MKIPDFLYLVIAVFFCQIGLSQTIWQGQFHSNRIIILGDFTSKNDSLQLSIPELLYNNIKVNVLSKEDSLCFENKVYRYSFKGKYNKDKTALFGVFNSSSISNANIVLKKQSEIQPLYFSQSPVKPYPYQEIDMTFLGKKTGLLYGGTLCIPQKLKKYPLVILISGTGQHERNYTYSGREFFTVLADYLARRGIATLRLDDRGIGKTTGDFEKATTGDFADDVNEAISFLKSLPNIDSSTIGLLGHSEGGMIASIVSARSKEVKFMISLSGVGVSGLEMLNLQNRAILKSYNFSDEVVAKQMELYNILFKAVYDTKNDESVRPALEIKLKEWMSKQDYLLLKKMQLADGRDQSFLYRYAKDADRNWYRFHIHYNPADYLPKITVPALILNGDKDIQVPAAENVASFKKFLKTKDLTTKIYPGLNHMYQHCNTCTQKEVKELDEIFAIEVLEDISTWINKQFKKH